MQIFSFILTNYTDPSFFVSLDLASKGEESPFHKDQAECEYRKGLGKILGQKWKVLMHGPTSTDVLILAGDHANHTQSNDTSFDRYQLQR